MTEYPWWVRCVFIIPGLIAFPVDFSTGAIYLPPDEEGGGVIYLDPEDMTPERIAAAISEHTGREVTAEQVREEQGQRAP